MQIVEARKTIIVKIDGTEPTLSLGYVKLPLFVSFQPDELIVRSIKIRGNHANDEAMIVSCDIIDEHELFTIGADAGQISDDVGYQVSGIALEIDHHFKINKRIQGEYIFYFKDGQGTEIPLINPQGNTELAFTLEFIKYKSKKY